VSGVHSGFTAGLTAGYMFDKQTTTGRETAGSHGFVLEDNDDGDEYAISVRRQWPVLSCGCLL